MQSNLEFRRTFLALMLLACFWCNLNSVWTLKDNTPTCRDEDGNPVDWFIAYKLPKILKQKEPYGSGTGYVYITSELGDNQVSGLQVDDDEVFLDSFRQLLREHLGIPEEALKPGMVASWRIAKYPIDHEDSIIKRSLAPAYSESKPDTLDWIFYNDQAPTPANGGKVPSQSSTRAHAKGAILIDSANGDAMWLTHSVPLFPPAVDEPLEFNNHAFRHGQTFMCLNYDARVDGDKVTRHLSNMFASVYHSKVSSRLRKMIPELNGLKLQGETTGLSKNDRLSSLDQMITTRGGQQFEIFSKSSLLEGDLYAGWLTEQLDSALYVESWRNGFGDPLDSDCPANGYHVNNIKSLRLISGSKTLFSWSYLKDHSKWAISETREDGVVCLADINRMSSQFKRGGGAVCLKCPKCWSVLSSTIEELEACKYAPKVSKKKKISQMRQKFVQNLKELLP